MSIKKKIQSGLFWRGSSDLLQNLSQIFFTILFARLLGLEDFGLIAMALLINRFVRQLTNIGFGTAIIQSQKVSKEQISAIFYIQLFLNLFISIVIFYFADYFALFFEEKKLASIVKVTSLSIFIQSFHFPVIILRKNLDFKNYSIIEIFVMFVSNFIGLLFAYNNYGVWSLVYRLLSHQIIFSILIFYFSGWKPSKANLVGLSPLVKFGFDMWLNKIIYFFAENMIGILTGKFLGKEIMGLFNIAYNLSIMPATKIQTVLASVLTPGFSIINKDSKKFKQNFTKVLKYSSLVFIPFMSIIMGSNNNFINVLYGEKWSGASDILFILLLVGILRGLSHLIKSAIVSKGYSSVIFKATIIEVIFSLPLMFYFLPIFSIQGLCFSYFIGSLSSTIYLSRIYDKVLSFRNGFLKTIFKAIMISVCLFFLTFLLGKIMMFYKLQFLIQITLSILIYLILIKNLENEFYLTIKRKILSIS